SSSELEAAVHTAVQCKTFPNLVHRHFQFQRNSDCGSGVQHIVGAGYFQMKAAEVPVMEAERELGGEWQKICPGDPEIRLGTMSVCHSPAIDERQNLLDILIIQAENGSSIKRNFVDEINKCRADGIE